MDALRVMCSGDAAPPACESSSEFTCLSDGVCINKVLRCDGVNHCVDASDERACNYTGECVNVNVNIEFI